MSTIEVALNSLKENAQCAEIAFFGGSFTAIDRDYMLSLLEQTVPYIDRFKGIRISTRPDCIDDEILTLLKKYKVTSIELGAQSMNDTVLLANNRGHSALDVVNASYLIKDYGFSLGLQMMTGLFKSTDEIDIQTACEFIKLKPDTVRIYPTVIMKNTRLEELYNNGEYVPKSLDEAVNLCSKLLCMFSDKDINVIRLGLHYSESLEKTAVAGAYHPAFRELCESKIMFDKLLNLLDKNNIHSECEIMVSPSCVSKMIGNKKSNIKRLYDLGYNVKIIQSNVVPDMEVVLKN